MEELLFSNHHQHQIFLSSSFSYFSHSFFLVFRSVFSTFNFCLLFVQVPVLDWNRRPPTDSTLAHSSSLFFYCFRCRSGDYLALLFLSGPPSLPDCIALLWSRTHEISVRVRARLARFQPPGVRAGPTGLSNGNRIIRLAV